MCTAHVKSTFVFVLFICRHRCTSFRNAEDLKSSIAAHSILLKVDQVTVAIDELNFILASAQSTYHDIYTESLLQLYLAAMIVIETVFWTGSFQKVTVPAHLYK